MSFKIPPMPSDTPQELKVYFNNLLVEVQAVIVELEDAVQSQEARIKALEAKP